MKTRSKHFLSLSEVIAHTHIDVEKKIEVIYGKGEHFVKQFMMMNPELALGMAGVGSWDRNCISAVYFSEGSAEDDDMDEALPLSWMFKYEIYFYDDTVDVMKNGEHHFSPYISPEGLSSAYH